MKLFELRAVWIETYDCPDNGLQEICEKYETIAYAKTLDLLQLIKSDLESEYKGLDWSLERCQELRKLYPGFDDWRETEYKIADVTSLILQ